MQQFNNLLKEFKRLQIPIDEYIIVGSGALAIRNIRDSNDLDIIVSQPYFTKLLEQHSLNKNKLPREIIDIGELEIGNKWEGQQVSELLDKTEIIEGMRFFKLENIIAWKQNMGREKDLKDLELIKQWKNNNS